jgi:hypothetical protein
VSDWDRGLFVGRSSDAIVDAATRLLDLMAQPEDAGLLGPLVIDEILIRLLRSSIGARVAQIGEAKSGVRRIAEAVSWIREHFAQPVTVNEMAASVRMSASSFHQRFKAVTSMSPLQYSEDDPSPRGASADTVSIDGRDCRQRSRRVSESVAVQPGVQPLLRKRADQGCRPAAQRGVGPNRAIDGFSSRRRIASRVSPTTGTSSSSGHLAQSVTFVPDSGHFWPGRMRPAKEDPP